MENGGGARSFLVGLSLARKDARKGGLEFFVHLLAEGQAGTEHNTPALKSS